MAIHTHMIVDELAKELKAAVPGMTKPGSHKVASKIDELISAHFSNRS